VLDAGAGSGSYLPWIVELVGPTGRISSLGIAPENVALVEVRLSQMSLDCPVAAVKGKRLDLLLPDNHFDAVWCANTSQYLSDDEVEIAVREFKRVVRPGGMVAIKDATVTNWNVAPGNPARFWQLLDRLKNSDPQVHGFLRTPELGS
jgi:arsenite methyltransferase